MTTKSVSLHRGLARRLGIALLTVLLVAGAGMWVIFRIVSTSVAEQQLQDASAHFRARITDIEDNWRLQAEGLRAQLLVTRLLDEPDARQRQARLIAFVTALGGEGTFTHVVLLDAEGHVMHRYRTRSQQDLPLPTGAGILGWTFGERDDMLYRSVALPISVAGARGQLVLYAPIDTALLRRNVYPDTTVCVLWQGREVAESPRLADGTGNIESASRVERRFEWTPGLQQPLVQIERRVVLPLSIGSQLALLTLAIAAIGVMVWLVLGRWLTHQSRRIVSLKRATDSFTSDGHISDATLESLQLAEGPRPDEIAMLAVAVRGAMHDIARQEGALLESQRRFRDMAELSSDWFWEQDTDLRFTYMSHELLQISGMDNASVIGKQRWELPIIGLHEREWEKHRALLARREPFRDLEYQIINDVGETRWSSISGKPLFDDAGVFAGYRGTGRDITSQKQAQLALRESETRLRALLELSSDWYWVHDTEYRLTLREGAILNKMGMPAERDLGKRPWEMGFINMTEEQWQAHRALLDRREEFRDQLLGRMTDEGRMVWALLSGRPRFNAQGQYIGYHGIGRSVTQMMEAERVRKERESEVALLIENAPASISLFDTDLVLRLVNSSHERLWKLQGHQLVGKHLRELVGDTSFEEIEPQFRRALAGKASSYRRSGTDTEGKPHVVDVTLTPNVDSSGVVTGVYGIAVDVTERIQSDEVVRSLQHLFTSTFQNTTDLMAIYRVEPGHLIIEGFNQALWRFYEEQYPDVKMADWHGRAIDEFLRVVAGLSEAEIDQRLAGFWEVVNTGTIKRYQTTLPTQSGPHRRDALLVPITSDGGRVTHLFYRGADITDLVRKEHALQALNAELERKVAERTAELTSTNSELEAFAYAVSHDLRTPLRGIDGFSKLLEEEHGAKLGDGGISYVQRIRRGISRMGALIDDMLHLSHVTRGPLRRAPVDLSAMADDIAKDLQVQSPARQITWRIDPGISVIADPGQMRLLLENLLGNAFKYSRNVARAEISLVSVPNDSATEFIVRDNGAGFDMAYAGKLFQPFQRLHGPKEFEGTGVGLATVMRVITRHGGSITAEAQPGRGAEFRIVLPQTEETA